MIKDYSIKEGAGVYCFENLINGKVYIGSSQEVCERVAQHLRHIRNNNHPNKKFKDAINKYGFDKFRYFILDYCENYVEREQEYFDIFLYAQLFLKDNTDRRFFKLSYNNNPIAESASGRSVADEERDDMKKRTLMLWSNPEYRSKQMSIRTKEWYNEWISHMPLEYIEKRNSHIASTDNKRRCAVLAYDRFTGSFIREFESILEAERQLEISHGSVNSNLSGKMRFTNDMIFKYKLSDDFPLQIEPIPNFYKDENKFWERLSKMQKSGAVPITGTDLNTGISIDHESIDAAAKYYGIYGSGIGDVIHGRRKKYKHYTFVISN